MKHRVSTTSRIQWIVLGGALSFLGALIAVALYADHLRSGRQEGQRLAALTRIIDGNLAAQLEATSKLLATLRHDALAPGAISNTRLKMLENAHSGIRTLLVVDAGGVIRHSNREEVVGRDISQRAYFQAPRERPDTATLFLSPPFKTVLNTWTLNVSLPILDRHGTFHGVVSAALDPAYFRTLMQSVNYASDSWTYIAHGDGLLFLIVPEKQTQPGKNLDHPDAFFTRHIASGRAESLFEGIAYVTGEERLIALRTFRPGHLVLDKPLIVAASRDLRTVFAGWRRLAWAVGGLFVAIALGSALALWLFQRHQRNQQVRIDATDARVRRHEREFRALVEASAQIVWNCNTEGAVVEDSPSWRAYTGQTPEQWLGFGYIDCIHPDDRPAVMARWLEGLQRGTSVVNEYRLRRADGAWRWTQARGVPIRNDDGSIASWVGMNIDIHEQKCAALAMQAAKEAAEAASLAKSQFLATMSHEIRTPMNGILGMAQLLLQPALAEDERRDYARTVLNSGQTLLTLLNDILDLSKVEAGRLELMHALFDPTQLIDETAALFAEPAHGKGLAIDAAWNGPEGVDYWADPIRLRQMLSNLLSNAIKFSDHGRIRVAATEIERDVTHATLEFSVGDEGIGIAADKQRLLFRPFSQVDGSSTRRFGGTGLGLSIVRSLSESMGGCVGVDSVAGQGSRFWFRIRAALAQEGQDGRRTARATAAAVAARSGAGSILVAEDDPINCQVIEAMLTKNGFDVRCVDNGQAALAAVTDGPTPDLVLMDCQMPVMDGLEATRRLRRLEADNGRPRLPIVALTARAFAEDREQCLAAGMDEFVAKPVKLDELIQIVRRWIGSNTPPA